MAATKSSSKSVPVQFVCQHCLSPLNLDRSFSVLDENALTELSAPLLITSENDDTVTLIGGDTGGVGKGGEISSSSVSSSDCVMEFVNRKVTPPIRLTESGNGFTLVDGDHLSNHHHDETGSLSHAFKVSSRLFDIVSDQSDVDHPLCEECTDSLLDHMDHLLKVTEDEYRDYQEFLEKFEGETSESSSENVEELRNELERLRTEEQKLLNELKQVEEEKERADEELAAQNEERERLHAEEERYLREYFGYKRKLLIHGDEQRSVENQLHYAQAQLDKLKKTNVFNASFHIWHSGHFGTINNFRLGRLPNVPVEWNEINAAWGQTVLLLHSLAKKIDLNFQRYRLVPYGNHSYLECLTDRSKELPLYGSGGIRFFWDTKFDQAMVAFLDCLQQFKEEVEKGDTGFCLPYRMERGHIEDTGTGNSYSVKTQFNSEEQWTKALKYMLTNLKWGLAWVSSQFVNK